MKTIVSLLAIFIIFFGIGAAITVSFPSKSSLIPTERAETVTLYMDGAGPAYAHGLGSGVYLGKGLILTARHVVANNILSPDTGGTHLLYVRFHGRDDVVMVEPVFFSEDADYALVRIDPKKVPSGVPSASLSCKPLAIGDNVTAVGSPLGIGLQAVSSGRVANIGDLDNVWFTIALTEMQATLPLLGWEQLDMATFPIQPGNSGGPVFDDQGRVVGEVVAGFGTIAGFIPATQICAELPR